MHNEPLFFIAAIGAVIVAIILMVGIGGFARGGEFNRRNGNRMMRWRLIAQAVALAVVMFYIFMKGG